MNKKVSSESVVKDIRRRTRKKYSSEEKIRIVLDGLRGEDSISSLCRRDGSYSGCPLSSYDPREDRTLSSVYEEYRQASELLLSLGTGTGNLKVRRILQQPSISRIFNNVTPADVYFSRNREILTKRDRIKRKTLALRKKQNLKTRVA